MIDARLRSQNTYLTDMDERIGLARQVLLQDWYPDARSAVTRYVDGLLNFWDRGRPELEKDWVKAYCASTPLAAFLPDPLSWPAEFIADVQHALCEPNDREHESAHWIIGQALAEALVQRGRVASDISHIAHLASAHDVRIFGFVSALQALNGEDFEVIVITITGLVDKEKRTAQRYLLPRHRENLDEVCKAWGAETDFGAIWDSRIWIGMDMYAEDLAFLGVLSAHKPQELVQVVERLELLPLVESVLRNPAITMDMDRLLELLEKAPPIVDSESGRWNRNVVAAVLLQIAFEHVVELGRESRSNDDKPFAEEPEVRQLVAHIVARALNRADGKLLVTKWMCHLIHQMASRSGDTLQETIVDAALDAFARSSVSFEDVYTRPGEEVVPRGVLVKQLPTSESEVSFSQLVLAIMLEERRLELTGAVSGVSLRPVFQNLLRYGRDAFRPTYNERASSWRHQLFARLYLRESQPAKAWREDFDAFSLESRAGLHRTYTEDGTLAAPGLFLAGVGVALVELCSQGGDDSTTYGQALPIWQEVFDATRPFFTHWSLSHDQWRAIASGLFARLPFCASVGDPQPVFNQAKQSLDLLGGDETLFATALANLVSNGAAIDQIAGTQVEADVLKERIRRYLQWEVASGSRNLSEGVATYWTKNLPPTAVKTHAPL